MQCLKVIALFALLTIAAAVDPDLEVVPESEEASRGVDSLVALVRSKQATSAVNVQDSVQSVKATAAANDLVRPLALSTKELAPPELVASNVNPLHSQSPCMHRHLAHHRVMLAPVHSPRLSL